MKVHEVQKITWTSSLSSRQVAEVAELVQLSPPGIRRLIFPWYLVLVGGLEHFLFFCILGRIIPTDVHIFQRGRYTTNQGWWMLMVHWWFLKDVSPIFNSYVKIPEGIWLMVHWWFLSNFQIYFHHSHFRISSVLETNQKCWGNLWAWALISTKAWKMSSCPSASRLDRVWFSVIHRRFNDGW